MQHCGLIRRFSLVIFIEVGSFCLVEDDIVFFHVLVQLTAFLLEVHIRLLVFFSEPFKVLGAAHFAVVAPVVLDHVAQRLLTLDVDLIEFLDEHEGGCKVGLKGHQLFVVLEAHERYLRCVFHQLIRLIVRQLDVCSSRVKVVK